MRDYTKYSIWKESHEFVLRIYKVTQNFPPNDHFGIVNQMCRASSSIPTNIVEGCGRESDQEFKRYLVIARGSASEMEYHLLLSKDLGYLSEEEYLELFDSINKIKRSINNLINKVTNRA